MLREIGKRETEVAALQARCVRRLGLADPGPAGRRPDDIGSTPWAAWMTFMNIVSFLVDKESAH